MEKAVLEYALKRFWKEDSVSKVISFDGSTAVEKNTGHLSTISRLTLKVVLKNGRSTTRSLIVKDTKNDKLAEDQNVFKVETMMYKSVLTEMEYLMNEFEDNEGIFWCHLVHYSPYKSLILEDLNASGYNILKKCQLLDLDHTLMVVHTLGRFHGMSKILEERRIVNADGLRPWFIFNDHNTHRFWTGLIMSASKGIKKYWRPYWTPIVERINVTIEKFKEKMEYFKTVCENKFRVLNHGDCHRNNILFKHNWKNRLIDMRIVDFQMPHYSSPCCDLTYFLHIGPDPFVRRENFDVILKVYHDSLLRTLNNYGYGGKKPDLEEIKELMDEFSYLGLLIFISIFPSQMRAGAFEYKKIMETGGTEGYNLEMFDNKLLEQAMGPDIEKFVQKYF